MQKIQIDAATWATLNRLLDDALDQPAAQLPQWLDDLAPQFDGLKPRLRELLSRTGLLETDEFLHTLPKFELGPGDVAAAPARAEQPGQEIGPYRLVRELGSGGIPGTKVIKPEQISQLEQVLDRFNDPLPALKDFILPGGGPAAAHCHLARTVVRRAERCVWTLAANEQVNIEVPKYLNRLSDLLFVLARVLARHEKGSEVLWRHDRGR